MPEIKTQTKGNWLLSAQSIILADDDMGYTYNRSSLKTSKNGQCDATFEKVKLCAS